MTKELWGITKEQMQEFHDNAFDAGFLEATKQIKKAMFGAKNMAKARLRIVRIENAVAASLHERKLKRDQQRTENENNPKPESNSSSAGGSQGESGCQYEQPAACAQGDQRDDQISQET